MVSGLRDHFPDIDLVRAQDVGLRAKSDSDVLEWAARDGRVLLSHDAATVPEIAFQYVAEGKPMLGVFIVRDSLPIRPAIEEIAYLSRDVEYDSWKNQVIFLPL